MAFLIVVDDDPISCQLLARYLQREGHEVRAVATGREAIDAGSTREPQVLLTDWLLKDTYDGIDVARMLQRQWPGMQIVFMTGLPIEHLKDRTAGLRVAKLVEKPFLIHELMSELRIILAS